MTFDRLLYLVVSQSMDLIELSVIQGHTQKACRLSDWKPLLNEVILSYFDIPFCMGTKTHECFWSACETGASEDT